MAKFKEKLERLIMFNKFEQAIEELFNSLSQYSSDNYETKDIKRQLIILSSSWYELTEKGRLNTVSLDEYNQNKNRLFHSFLTLIEDLPNYPNLYSFLNKDEKSQPLKSPLIHSTANESPHPILLWKRHNIIEDIDEIDLSLKVKSKPNAEEAIEKLLGLVPSKEVFERLKNDSKEIEESIRKYEIEGFTGNEKISDLRDKLLQYSNDIESRIKQLKSNPDHLQLKERAFLPKFTIVNKGDLPAINISILIEPSEKILFLNKLDLNNKDVHLPTRHPQNIKRIIELVENRKQLTINTAKRKNSIIQSHIGIGDIVLSDKIIKP